MEQYEHGGNVWQLARKLNISVKDIVDLSSCVSVNMPSGIDALFQDSSILSILPEPYSATFSETYSLINSVPSSSVLLTSGTTEAIAALCSLYRGKVCGILAPTYSDYERYANIYSMDVKYITSGEGRGFTHDYNLMVSTAADIYFICNPNNPTGRLIEKLEIREAASQFPDSLFVVDESYIGFTDLGEFASLRQNPPANIVVLRSYSKVFGVPGARLGYMVAAPEIIFAVKSVLSPWSVSTLGQKLAGIFLDLPESPLGVLEDKKEFYMLVENLSPRLRALHSATNFITCILRGISSSALAEKCASAGILIRDCSNIRGLDNRFIRLSMGDNWRRNIKKIGIMINEGL